MVRLATEEDLPNVREIFREYANSLPASHICTLSFDLELESVAETYPTILLAFHSGIIAGCVAMRHIDARCCEMKRLYVREKFRGSGLGKNLVHEVLRVAGNDGFGTMRLDTLTEFTAAIHLYRTLGFQEIPPYRNQGAGVICMELELNGQTESKSQGR